LIAEIAEKGFTTEDTESTGEFGQKLLIAEIAEKGFTTEDTGNTGLSSHGHPSHLINYPVISSGRKILGD
jgi:hypothetical protein